MLLAARFLIPHNAEMEQSVVSRTQYGEMDHGGG